MKCLLILVYSIGSVGGEVIDFSLAQVILAYVIIMLPLDFVSSLICFQRGNKTVKYYIIARSFYLFIVSYTCYMNILDPGSSYYTPYFIRAAVFWESIFFSLALAHGLNYLKVHLVLEEKERQEAMKGLVKMKQFLEDRVRLRSLKLDRANHDLEKMIKELKIAENELVEKEKQAELGKLVSKVASLTEKPVKQCFGSTTRISLALLNLEKSHKQRVLTKDAMESLIYLINRYIPKLQLSLKESSKLIQTFKNIAVVEGVDELTSFSLPTYIKSLVTSLYSSDSSINIQISNKEDVELDSYQSLIYQIITRLVENSKQHAFENVASPQIDISMEKSASGITLCLKDNGHGIPQNELESVFEAFYTLDKSHPTNGLGLHIVKNLVVHRLQGKIHCESAEGEGLTVVIELPLKIKESQAA